jgi:hypothetical protein
LFDKAKSEFVAEERGEHPVDAVRNTSSRGIDTASRQMCLDILKKKPNTEPKTVIEELKSAGIASDHLPSSIQLNNLKSVLKQDRSSESPHRIETIPQLKTFFEHYTVKSVEDYNRRG